MRNKTIHTKNNSTRITYNKSILNNGLVLISETIEESKSFSLGYTFVFGTRHEEQEKNGIAHLLEHMVFRNSKKRSGKKIVNDLENIGAYINAFTTKEFTCYYLRALSNNFEKSNDILSDILLSPDFKDDDLKKEKTIILEEINSYEDDPEEKLFDLSDYYLFSNNHLANTILGTPDSLKRISTRDLEEVHKSQYLNGKLVICYIGNLKHSKVKAIIESKTSEYEFKNQEYFDKFKKDHTISKVINFENNFNQSQLLFTKYIPETTEREKFIWLIINNILGDGMSSRLYQRIREDLGLTYNIYSSLSFYKECGTLSIYSGTDIRNFEILTEEIEKELDKLAIKGIKKSELNRAKELIKSSLIMESESLTEKMQILTKDEIYSTKTQNIENQILEIDRIEVDEVNTILREVFLISDWVKLKMK